MKSQDAVRRVTIADVARHAGVSTAAVSKVLRNAYGVSPDMSQRVRSSMAELGYRPHAAARSMRGRSFTIGLPVGSPAAIINAVRGSSEIALTSAP